MALALAWEDPLQGDAKIQREERLHIRMGLGSTRGADGARGGNDVRRGSSGSAFIVGVGESVACGRSRGGI